MKQFAFPFSVAYKNETERNSILEILSSLGYSTYEPLRSNTGTILTKVKNENKDGKSDSGFAMIIPSGLVQIDDLYNNDRYNIACFEPVLIRDIAAAGTGSFWSKNEPFIAGGYYYTINFQHGCDVSKHETWRRATLEEICEHHGYEIKGRDIVKKEFATGGVVGESISNCDKSYCDIAMKLDTAQTEIKRLKEENVKLSKLAIAASLKAERYERQYNNLDEREGKLKGLIRDIMDVMDME